MSGLPRALETGRSQSTPHSSRTPCGPPQEGIEARQPAHDQFLRESTRPSNLRQSGPTAHQERLTPLGDGPVAYRKPLPHLGDRYPGPSGRTGTSTRSCFQAARPLRWSFRTGLTTAQGPASRDLNQVNGKRRLCHREAGWPRRPSVPKPMRPRNAALKVNSITGTPERARAFRMALSGALGGLGGLAVTLVFSRSLPGHQFGTIITVMAIGNIAISMTSAGYEHATTKHGFPRVRKARSLLAGLHVVEISLVLAMASLLMTARLDSEVAYTALLMAPSFLFAALMRVEAALRRGDGYYASTYWSNALGVHGPRLAGACLAALSAVALPGLALTVSLVGLTMWLILHAPAHHALEQSLEEVKKPLASTSISHWIRFAHAWKSHALAQALLSWADIPLIAALISIEAAGYYAFATRLGIASRVFLAPLGAWYATETTRHGILPFSSRDPRYGKVRTYGMFLVMVTGLLLILTAPIIFDVGQQNLDRVAWILLVTLTGASVVDASFGPNAWALGFRGQHALMARIEWISTATSLVLIFLLVPYYGLVGAAAAWSFAILVGNVLRQLELRRSLQSEAG
jgi:O-antigen/teichoic acid export membrane protein